MRNFLFKHEALFYLVAGLIFTMFFSLFFLIIFPFGFSIDGFIEAFKLVYFFGSGIFFIQGFIGLIYPKYLKGNNVSRSAAIHYLGILIAYVAKHDYASAGIISAICLAFAFNIGVSEDDD